MTTRMTIVLLVMLATALAEDQVPPAEQETEQRKMDTATVAKPNNVFGCELYAKLREQEGNIFFSPASICGALAMAYAGAAGRTALQMVNSLHFGLPVHRFHTTFGHLMEELNSPPEMRGDPAYQLVVSNALWLQRGYPWDILSPYMAPLSNQTDTDTSSRDSGQEACQRPGLP